MLLHSKDVNVMEGWEDSWAMAYREGVLIRRDK